jgi:hypothetical protein
MATFEIAPVNDLEFKARNGLLPNYSNTLSCEEEFIGVVRGSDRQKFISSDKIRNQLKTDYDINTGSTIEALLIDSLGNETSIVVFKVIEATDPLNGWYAFYEFEFTGYPAGTYYMTIKATNPLELNNLYFQSEPFDIVESITNYRYGSDGTKFPYETIPNHFKVLASNSGNQIYNYWGNDRIQGDPFEVNIWMNGHVGKQQMGGEIDNYDNQGSLTILKSISQRVFELKTEAVAPYLLFKMSILSKVDSFYINNAKYSSDDNFEFEYFANYTYPVLTGTITESNSVALNSDDQGYIIIDNNDMAAVIPKVKSNASGSQQLVIDGGYSLNQITIQITAGASVTVRIGTTPSGSEILRDTTVLSSEVVENIARNYVNQSDPSASFTAYIEITGVGASATITLQTIINKQ